MASKDMHRLCMKIKPEDSMFAHSRLQAVTQFLPNWFQLS
jgi:hypothetical protein